MGVKTTGTRRAEPGVDSRRSSREAARRGADRRGRVGLEVDRILGRVDGPRAGPLLLAVGGLHGNEPAGVLGLRRVLSALEGRSGRLRGNFVALGGNRAALRVGRRFLDEDLNRLWTPERAEALLAESRSGGRNPMREDEEQREILETIERIVRPARSVHVLDLHTTSGSGGAFTTVADTLPNREFALQLPVPLLLGLEELVEGTFLEYMGEQGYVTMAFESGQHDDPVSVDRAEAGIWIALVAAGILRTEDVPGFEEHHALLARDAGGLPTVLEMRHRHAVEPGDGFRMAPGFQNFQLVAAGDVVAHDHTGPVRATESARILMPLYQEQGNDGFFLVREFRPVWLRLSTWLRRLRMGRFVHWLPGIRRGRGRSDLLVVDRRVARWYALQVLHLLGFRKHREVGDQLVVLRRRWDRFADLPGVGDAPREAGGEPGTGGSGMDGSGSGPGEGDHVR